MVLGPAGAAAGVAGNASKLGALLNFASSVPDAGQPESAPDETAPARARSRATKAS